MCMPLPHLSVSEVKLTRDRASSIRLKPGLSISAESYTVLNRFIGGHVCHNCIKDINSEVIRSECPHCDEGSVYCSSTCSAHHNKTFERFHPSRDVCSNRKKIGKKKGDKTHKK